MLSKLKFIGTFVEDLLHIYCCYVRSRAEYCSVAFHGSLTIREILKIENIQKTSLKVILGENYIGYPEALEMTNFKSLYDRREEKCLSFALKAHVHPRMSKFFPYNPESEHNTRFPEKFLVNFAHTESYKRSSIPLCQRLLNLQTA